MQILIYLFIAKLSCKHKKEKLHDSVAFLFLFSSDEIIRKEKTFREQYCLYFNMVYDIIDTRNILFNLEEKYGVVQ